MANVIKFEEGGDRFANVTHHVGRDQPNEFEDVLLIQAMLSTVFAVGKGPFRSPLKGPLRPTGKLDAGTLTLIRHYQDKIQHRARPDGFISPARPVMDED